MKTIGVIGGMGPQATMDFEARIHRISQKLIPQFVNRGYPPIVVYYVSEAPMVLNSDGSTPEKLEPAPQLLDAAKKVAIIAADDTLKHRIYPEPHKRKGISNITITKEPSRRLDEEIRALIEGN